MNILYIHGFASSYDQFSVKVQALKTIGEVSGVDIDYSEPLEAVVDCIYKAILDNDIDLLVGTSMGGYCSALLGSKYGIPFVAINPATNPRDTLIKYIGLGTTFAGADYLLTKDVVDGYEPIVITEDACGLILLDEGDEVLNSEDAYELLKSSYPVKMFKGGCHRFDHMSESLVDIVKFYNQTSMSYGLDND